jgi:hypothetical protein
MIGHQLLLLVALKKEQVVEMIMPLLHHIKDTAEVESGVDYYYYQKVSNSQEICRCYKHTIKVMELSHY